MGHIWLTLYVLLIVLFKVQSDSTVNITIIEGATATGAVCLDGSPPSYAMDKGSGPGANNWVIYLEQGGWCTTIEDCARRAKSSGGSSSSSYRNSYSLSGILDVNATFNPDFYNWNKVAALYCDGSSFFGNVDEVDPQNNLHFRGSRIFKAIIQELAAKGMAYADNILLSGGSAGGLATILNCDGLRSLVPYAKTVKCLSDSGFFLHAPNLPGVMHREQYFSDVVQLHGLANLLPQTCTSRMSPNLCLFPEYLVEDIKTPLFLLESSFDLFQIQIQYTPYVGGGRHEWFNCVHLSLSFCNSTQIEKLQEFHTTFVQTLQNLNYSPFRGAFVHNCFRHGHIMTKDGWTCSRVTVENAVRDWYFDGNNFQYIATDNLPRNCTSPLDNAFDTKCMKTL
ncbi:pectinacetylesterase family protein [Striga asiatica]|uniref:Pectin acetylesterase n=1 Tax=Striga asiatica TaxID=4170 RepID=A0A5A7PCI7_STRAF|nr:pectinacetylesterase family protein [Striga asiatica]